MNNIGVTEDVFNLFEYLIFFSIDFLFIILQRKNVTLLIYVFNKYFRNFN